jgi:sugar/nucleoside kinase (ribokinase family)
MYPPRAEFVHLLREDREINMPRFDVTIAGELNLDLILYGLPDELPPERELLADRMMLTLGSSSAIVAHNLAALESRVGFQSLIGDDALGQIAIDRLAEGGVDLARVRRVHGPTTTGLTVILHHPGGRNILTYAGTIAELALKDLDFDYLSDSRHFHFSSLYLQRALQPDVGELFRRLKAAGLTISLDTNDDPEDLWGGGLKNLLKYVDVLLPNAREATRITETDDPEIAIKRLAEMVPLVVVKGRWPNEEQSVSPALH